MSTTRKEGRERTTKIRNTEIRRHGTMSRSSILPVSRFTEIFLLPPAGHQCFHRLFSLCFASVAGKGKRGIIDGVFGVCCESTKKKNQKITWLAFFYFIENRNHQKENVHIEEGTVNKNALDLSFSFHFSPHLLKNTQNKRHLVLMRKEKKPTFIRLEGGRIWFSCNDIFFSE